MNATLKRTCFYWAGLYLLCGCATVRESFTDRRLPCPFAANDLQQGQKIPSSARKAEVFIYPFHSDDFIEQSIRKGLYIVRLRKPLDEVSRIQACSEGFRLWEINGHHSKTMGQAVETPFGATIYAEVLPGHHKLCFVPFKKSFMGGIYQKTKDVYIVDFIAQPGAWYRFEKELIHRQTVRLSEPGSYIREDLVQEGFRIFCVSLIDGRQQRELLVFREVSENTYRAFYPVER